MSHDYQLWQQHFPALQPTFNNPNDIPTGNSNVINSLSKHSQQSYREYDPRSLLGKFVFFFLLWISNKRLSFAYLRVLRNDHGVNKEETNEIHPHQQQDHISFLQSILLSTMITNLNQEQNQKENHF